MTINLFSTIKSFLTILTITMNAFLYSTIQTIGGSRVLGISPTSGMKTINTGLAQVLPTRFPDPETANNQQVRTARSSPWPTVRDEGYPNIQPDTQPGFGDNSQTSSRTSSFDDLPPLYPLVWTGPDNYYTYSSYRDDKPYENLVLRENIIYTTVQLILDIVDEWTNKPGNISLPSSTIINTGQPNKSNESTSQPAITTSAKVWWKPDYNYPALEALARGAKPGAVQQIVDEFKKDLNVTKGAKVPVLEPKKGRVVRERAIIMRQMKHIPQNTENSTATSLPTLLEKLQPKKDEKKSDKDQQNSEN